MTRTGLMALALAAGLAVSAAEPAFAQSGSTGGSLGKKGKSVSGGGAAKNEPAPEASAPAARGAPATRRNVMNGRWHVTQNCNTGRYEIVLTLRHTSPTAFEGSGKGLTTGASTTVYDGKVSGNRISLKRVVTIGTDVWSARLAANGRAFSGTARAPLWECKFTARKR